MKYISTRGNAPKLSFEEVLLTGLASDGGLYVPETLPKFSPEQIASWASLSYSELAFEIVAPFVDGDIPDEELREVLDETYRGFRHPAVAPMIQLAKNEWILELFHGPTLAFKDFALQLLGRLLDSVLKKNNKRVVILGATSGDTGSAAIEGCRRCENVDIFILHPQGRVSDFQRRQMTTVLESNVHNIAVQGNFDDCQNLVKTCFGDQGFLPENSQLVAVNSINWARIMAQIVYYFYAAVAVGSPSRKVAFSVPTGNFGDIFAGYLAHKMGLPISKLIIATNQNDVLHRVMTDAVYSQSEITHTLSPSMDISISSNFERLMFDLYGGDGDEIRNLMQSFPAQSIRLPEGAMKAARKLFDSAVVDDKHTCETISKTFEDTGYLLDPHSATGVFAARTCKLNKGEPVICLATAHPAKFSEAILQAKVAEPARVPDHMEGLLTLPERCHELENDKLQLQQFIVGALHS